MNLNEIQQKLKAPKNQRNNFGNYNYRSCEDILEAVKPLLGESTLTISDEIIMLGDRFYVKATVTFTNSSGDRTTVSAYAREALDKKGMDQSQITGAASSYARKYALNGLFLIDDTKDADTMDNAQNNKVKQEVKRGVKSVVPKDLEKFFKEVNNENGIDFNEFAKGLANIEAINELDSYIVRFKPSDKQLENFYKIIKAKRLELDKSMGQVVETTSELSFENQSPFEEV